MESSCPIHMVWNMNSDKSFKNSLDFSVLHIHSWLIKVLLKGRIISIWIGPHRTTTHVWSVITVSLYNGRFAGEHNWHIKQSLRGTIPKPFSFGRWYNPQKAQAADPRVSTWMYLPWCTTSPRHFTQHFHTKKNSHGTLSLKWKASHLSRSTRFVVHTKVEADRC